MPGAFSENAMHLYVVTVGQAKQLAAMFQPHAQAMGDAREASPFDALLGKNIMIRTVTMIFTGRLLAVYPQELVLVDAAWIADTKRWQQFISDGGIDACEPYPEDQRVIVGRGALIDATEWLTALPRAQQ